MTRAENSHPKLISIATLIVGLSCSLVFAFSIALSLSNILSDPVSADPEGENYNYLSSLDFSASDIGDFTLSNECEEKDLGQIVLVSDYEFVEDSDKRVEVAVSTGGFFTKRGNLKKVSENYVEKVSDGYKTSTGEEIDHEKIKTGLYFTNVPVDGELQIQLYSPSWDKYSINYKVKAIGKSCTTIFVYVDIEKNKKVGDFDVCVHSKDKAKDYSPKKTFSYPANSAQITEFEKQNTGSIVSLGPCQDGSALLREVNAKKQLAISEGEVESGDENLSQDSDNVLESTALSKMQFSANDTYYGNNFLEEVNEERKRHGLGELKENKVLTSFALKRLKTVIAVDEGIIKGEKGFVVGEEREGHPWMDRDFHSYLENGGTINAMQEIRTAGFPKGALTTLQVLDLYLNSSGHREAVLSPTAKSIGNAVLEYNGRIWHLANFEEGVKPGTIRYLEPLEM